MERIKLDLVPSCIRPVLHASQYDIGRQWWIELLNNGVPYVLQEDDVVEYEIRKGDGLVVTGSIAYIPGATYVILVSTEQMCAIYGSNLGELKISSNGAEIGTGNFILDVEKATTGGEKSKSVIWDLQAQVDDCTQKALENIGAKGLPFDNEDTDLEATNTEDAIKEVDSKVNGKADTSSLAEVATSGSYNDLLDKPSIPAAQVNSDWNANSGVSQILNKPNLSTVATSGDYNDLLNKPSVAVIDDSEASASKVYSSEKVETALNDKVSNNTFNTLKNRVDNVTVVHSGEKRVEISPFTLTAGYVGANGNISQSTSYHYTNKIFVSEGDKIYIYTQYGNYVSQYRFVCCYHNGSAVQAKGGQNFNCPFVVPSGIEEVILSIADTMSPTRGEVATVESKEQLVNQSDVNALVDISANAKQNSLFWEFDYTAGTTFNPKVLFEDFCSYKVDFFAKISTITGIAKIGKGIGNQYGGGIGFDGTNLYMYQNTSSTPTQTQAHGLTLKDYVSITLDSDYTTQLKVTIATNGGSYTWTISTWFAHYGSLSFSSPDNMTECKLAYTCEGLLKDTWLYGDSYFSNYDPKRWTYYLVSRGYRNYLLNAYGGRTSNSALGSFKTDLRMNRVPRRVIWCLGMNDKDGDSAVNTSWKNCVEEVMQICSNLHIELILATIPNVPSTNAKNIYKNAYVEASGYRYIDFAKAVSLNGDSTWYDGMLSSDNIHPEAQGALALYSQAVATVPELLL